MEASQDLDRVDDDTPIVGRVSEVLSRKVHDIASDYSDFVLELLKQHSDLSPDAIQALAEQAYYEKYTQLVGTPPKAEAEVIELPIQEAGSPDDEQAEAITLEGLREALRLQAEEDRLTHREELLALDFDTAVPGQHEEDINPEQTAEDEADYSIEIDLSNLNLKPSQLFILRNLDRVPASYFTRRDFYELGYEAEKSHHARSVSFPKNMRVVMAFLDQAVGQPLIIQEGIKGGSHFELLAKVKMVGDKLVIYLANDGEEPEPETEQKETPAENPGAADSEVEETAEPEEHLDVAESGEQNQEEPGDPEVDEESADDLHEPAVELEDLGDDEPAEDEEVEIDLGDNSETTHRIRRVERDIPTARKRPAKERMYIPPSKISGRFDPERVKDLDEVLASLVPRDKDEVLNNRDLKVFIERLMNDGKITDYRTKVVLAVRYGLYPPNFAKTATSINRNNQYVRLADLMTGDEPTIKRGQGLDLPSASELLTIEEVDVLQTEYDLLDSHRKESVAASQMADIIKRQLDHKKRELREAAEQE